MKQIRRGVFETNSSSTHSMTMCLKEEYDRWSDGELVLDDRYSKEQEGTFVTREHAIDVLGKKGRFKGVDTEDKDAVDEILNDNDFKTSNGYDSEYLEFFEEIFTTPSGEQVVAFGQFGYDG